MNLRMMKVYTTVVKKGVMARAADELNMTPAAISRTIADLELLLRTKLLHRSTRKLSLTVAGIKYYESCLRILEDVETLHYQFESHSKDYHGSLKIAAPMSYGLNFLPPILCQFQKAFPKVEVILNLEDSITDLVANGYDLAIRIQKKMNDSSLIAKKFNEFTHHLVCHPELLKNLGKVNHPQDLKNYPCLSYSYSTAAHRWLFYYSNKKFIHNFRPQMTVNNSLVLLELVIEKVGIALLPSFLVQDHLKTGNLVDLLPKYKKETAIGWLVYPSKQFQRPIVNQFSEFFLNGSNTYTS